MEALCEPHHVRVHLGIALATFDLHAGGPLAIPSALQLRDQTGLFQLRERTRNLAHGDFERIVLVGEVIARGREHPHPAPDQRQDTELLRHQITCEAGGILDNDRPHAIAFDPVEEGGETPVASRSGRRR